MKKFEILESIVPDIPATRVVLITDFLTPLAQWLNTLIQKREASLDIKVFCEDKTSILKESLKNKSKFLCVEPYLEESIRYDNKGYKYDALFLHLQNNPKDKIHLFERIYASMKNGGGVLIVTDKSKNELWSNIEVELEEYNFVAINPIELDAKCTVYYAKKMHGWDGAR